MGDRQILKKTIPEIIKNAIFHVAIECEKYLNKIT